MAEYFQIPEVGTKVRPGSYFNVDKNGDDDSFGAIDGVVVAVFKATFGPDVLKGHKIRWNLEYKTAELKVDILCNCAIEGIE